MTNEEQEAETKRAILEAIDDGAIRGGRPDTATHAGVGRSTDFETIEHARKDEPDVRFEGKLIGSVDSRDFAPAGKPLQRWTELEIWELRSGRWVVCAVACSDKGEEIDYATNVGTITESDEPAMQEAAMDALGYTWLAKELYGKLGWDAVETIT